MITHCFKNHSLKNSNKNIMNQHNITSTVISAAVNTSHIFLNNSTHKKILRLFWIIFHLHTGNPSHYLHHAGDRMCLRCTLARNLNNSSHFSCIRPSDRDSPHSCQALQTFKHRINTNNSLALLITLGCDLVVACGHCISPTNCFRFYVSLK